MSKVVKFSEYGGPNVLQVMSEKPLEPAADEVRLRMSAIALNRANAMFREGVYVYEASFPSRIGTEGIGTIEAVGADVKNWSVGQKANLLPPDNESDGGYAAEYVVVPQEKLIPAPKGLNDRLAATAWVPFLTIYHNFVEQKQAAEGRWIVLPAASSSVALAANNLAHYLGAKTIGITRTREKQQKLEAAGYDALVISDEENISERIIQITSQGADFIFDPVGGPTFNELAASIKPGGELSVYGALDSRETPLPIFPLMTSGAKVGCYMVYELLNDPERLKQAIAYYLELFESGELSPIVDEKQYNIDEVKDAFQHLDSNTQFGKVIVNI